MVMTFEETKQLEILKHENDMKELKYRNELDTAFDNQKTENQLKVLAKQKEIVELQCIFNKDVKIADINIKPVGGAPVKY